MQILQRTNQNVRATYTNFVTDGWLVRFMVFNATFNNISVISWWSVLMKEEIRVPRENH
jgi:hypothetical protein